MAEKESEDQYDILDLCMHMFSGSKDDYGTEQVPPLPLSFDRVNESRSPRSDSLLFKFPVEILGEILQHVDSSSLASLAFVNRDCRQWARSRQFASIHCDYGPETIGMLRHLRREMNEREANRGITVSPSLGACIRRITVATLPRCVTYRHRISLDEAFIKLDKEERDRRRADAGRFYYKTYLPIIQQLLSTPNVLPHLELLDWEDKVSLPRSFFEDLTRSRLQHLKLFRVCIDEEFTIGSPDWTAIPWPLRTLHLELTTQPQKVHEISLAALSASILSLCAPTLESLTWVNLFDKKGHSFVTAGLSSAPSFPCLRNLKLEHIKFLDSSMLDAFLKSKL